MEFVGKDIKKSYETETKIKNERTTKGFAKVGFQNIAHQLLYFNLTSVIWL